MSPLRVLVEQLHVALEAEAEFNGKSGKWRSTKDGTHIFIPDKGEPMVGKNLTLAKATALSKALKSKAAGAGDGGGAGAVTKANWKDKFKAIAKAAGHKLVHPFVAIKDLATKPEERKKLKEHIKKSIAKETAETKHLVSTIGKALKGEKVSAEDRKRAIHQTVDLVKTAMTAAAIGHLFAGGVLKAIATLTSPVDEVVAVAVDEPLRKITEKVFGQAHGLLPTAFYEGVESPDALLDKIIDAILDELATAEVEAL